ncbi:MAG: ArsR/SmtB family transcription factor [Nannocystales bacterium]
MQRSGTARLLEAAPMFAALGDEHRLRIVTRLSEQGPQPIVRLTEGTDISRQAVTKHLRALEGAGLLRSTRVGRERIWELQPNALDDAQRHLETISRQWDAAVDRLRAFVEED